MRTRAETKKRKIETIQARIISLNLSTADIERLAIKAGSAGLTVSELLENYIGDLVDGTYSNGSDERDLANQYFERCGFEYMAGKTFLRYLYKEDTADHVLNLWDTYESAKGILEDDDPEITPEEREYARQDMEESLNELNEYYAEYQAWADSEFMPFEAGMEELLKWKQDITRLNSPFRREDQKSSEEEEPCQRHSSEKWWHVKLPQEEELWIRSAEPRRTLIERGYSVFALTEVSGDGIGPCLDEEEFEL